MAPLSSPSFFLQVFWRYESTLSPGLLVVPCPTELWGGRRGRRKFFKVGLLGGKGTYTLTKMRARGTREVSSSPTFRPVFALWEREKRQARQEEAGRDERRDRILVFQEVSNNLFLNIFISTCTMNEAESPSKENESEGNSSSCG